MSVWQQGAVYRYLDKADLRCIRRWFDGPLEMVDLAHVGHERDSVFTRTARALAPCVLPRVTATLGGVCRPDACPHWPDYGRTVADAGPHTGELCCMACGGPAPPASPA